MEAKVTLLPAASGTNASVRAIPLVWWLYSAGDFAEWLRSQRNHNHDFTL